MNKLAIVIPAFKLKYFYSALESLAEQTDKRFNVYIGNDNSPFNLEEIVDRFRDKLNITYIRFSNNIGAEDLVHQWTRCVSLSTDEQWIWLFSDDDIAECNCVKKFYETIDNGENRFDILRFNTIVIDGDGRIISNAPVGPIVESSIEMAYNLLLLKRGNSMPDLIFTRKVYNESGGFVFTKFAQSADWATSIKFSEKNGIVIIPEARLFWRLSNLNISSFASKNKSKMINGYFMFLRWILKHFNYLNTTTCNNISYNDIKEACLYNLKHLIKYHYRGLDIKNSLNLFTYLKNDFGLSPLNSFKKVIELYIDIYLFWINNYFSKSKAISRIKQLKVIFKIG